MLTPEQVFWCNGVELKASREIWRKFSVNRYELNLLCCLTTYLSIHKRKCVAAAVLFRWLGVSDVWWKRAQGYVQGLHTKGCIHKLNYRQQAKQPGNSMAITEFGQRVLTAYFEAVKQLEAQKPKQYPKAQDIAVHSANIARDLPTYILVSAGRDN